MLILRRKAGESIVIGDEIKVTVIDINEGSIRLAIEAPKRITVLRSELLQAADANRDAAQQPAAQSPQSLLSILPQGSGQPARPVFRGKGKSGKAGKSSEASSEEKNAPAETHAVPGEETAEKEEKASAGAEST